MSSVERDILLCAAASDADSRGHTRLSHLMSLPKDEDLLVQMAVKEGLAGLVHRKLAGSGLLTTLGPGQRETLQSLYYQTVSTNLKLSQDLKEVLRKLNMQGVQVVLLQGIVLLLQAYEDIGLRPLSDIDLWVLKEDYPALVSILKGLGYQRNPVYPNLFRKGSTIFDLHTHLLWADRIGARRYLLRKDQDDLYRDTRPIAFEGQEARCLSASDQILYLSLHALKHRVEKLIWLVDIRCLLAGWADSDWEALVDRAEDLGQERTLSFTFFLLHELFHFHLPRKAIRLLERHIPRFLERKALSQRIEKGSLPLWAPLLLLSSEKGLAGRFYFALETLFPRPEVLRQIFVNGPNLRVWQLYWMRAVQLLAKIKRSSKPRPTTG